MHVVEWQHVSENCVDGQRVLKNIRTAQRNGEDTVKAHDNEHEEMQLHKFHKNTITCSASDCQTTAARTHC